MMGDVTNADGIEREGAALIVDGGRNADTTLLLIWKLAIAARRGRILYGLHGTTVE